MKKKKGKLPKGSTEGRKLWQVKRREGIASEGRGGFVTCLCWVSRKMLKAKWIGMDGPQYRLTDSN